MEDFKIFHAFRARCSLDPSAFLMGFLSLIYSTHFHCSTQSDGSVRLQMRCYFTYRVGYVICDASLGPEAAQKEMEVRHHHAVKHTG